MRSQLEDVLERVDGQDEQEWGKRVALPQVTPVAESLTRGPVEGDTLGGRGEEASQTSSKTVGESAVLQEIEDEVPTNSVESFGNVELDEEGGRLGPIQSAGHATDEHEIVMNAPSFDEGALAKGDQLMHLGAQAQRHRLREDLGHGMNEANRPVV